MLRAIGWKGNREKKREDGELLNRSEQAGGMIVTPDLRR